MNRAFTAGAYAGAVAGASLTVAVVYGVLAYRLSRWLFGDLKATDWPYGT